VSVIRRKRKQPLTNSTSSSATTLQDFIPSPRDAEGGGLQSQLAIDIEATRQRLDGVDLPQQKTSLGALTSLSEAYAAVWHDASTLSRTGGNYFLFEGKAVAWTDGETIPHCHGTHLSTY
jgi:hypothetical protein